MKMKLACGILAAGLVAIPAYGEGEEGEGQETQTPERTTATVVAGGTKTYTNPAHWDTGEVPSGYHANVHVDGDDATATKLTVTIPTSSAFTNGYIMVDAGDSIELTRDGNARAGHSWNATCITNNGSFVLNGGSGVNDQSMSFIANRAPSYFGPDSTVFLSIGRQGNSRTFEVLTDGTINEGVIEGSVNAPNKKTRSFITFRGDGTMINRGIIRANTFGSCTATGTDQGGVSCTFAGNCMIDGDGLIKLDNDGRSLNGTNTAGLKGGGFATYLTNGVNHTICGNGYISDSRICNYGVIRAEGTNTVLSLHITNMRNDKYTVTNNVTGRLIATGSKGLELKYNSKPNWNTHFVNLGLLESRTGSRIYFANGINSTSTHTGDSDLKDDNAYLKLDGRVAGGGLFQTIRPIHIMDGAKLMPGDLANDDGTGDSTCGTLSFATNLVLEAGVALAEGEGTTSGAITEFQCRKPEAGKYDSVWVNGDATVAGTFKFLENPSSGTYPLVTSTGTLTCDLKALKIECAEGVTAPKLKLVESTYEDVDAEGNPTTLPCQVLEATWVNGFTITVR